MTIACSDAADLVPHHQFPPAVIQHVVWLYLRFTFSYRDVEDLLAKRGLDITYETVPQWVLKFGAAIARNLRRLRPKIQPALAFG
jgi:putative transposase